ncbi:MAG TPA: hypothetical protein VF754_01090 [Pyrinomonadaceae bacterium]
MTDDSSIEFDMFEDARRNLVEALVKQGHDQLEAERVSLYVVQGIREVPRLLTTLARGDASEAGIIGLLNKVLDNAAALGKARAILLGLDDQIVH